MNLEDKAKLVMSLTDLTSLNNNETTNDIKSLCDKANLSNCAAVCIYPNYLFIAKNYIRNELKNNVIKLTTVINFPLGNNSEQNVLNEINFSIMQGAQEIDLVLDYNKLKDNINNYEIVKKLVDDTQKTCIANNITLKVIIESGELNYENLIELASQICIETNVNFIKTSTGKTLVSARLKDVEIILNTIKKSDKIIGVKASGGIKTILEAYDYIELARKYFGDEYIKPQTFRFGASSIFNDYAKIMKIDVELNHNIY